MRCLWWAAALAVLGAGSLARGETRQAGWREAGQAKVIQNRAYEKTGRHQLAAFGGFVPNDQMAWLFPVGGRYAYHITEMFAVEVHGAYLFSAQTGLARRMNVDQRAELMNPRESPVWEAFACGQWLPIYGKFALLGSTIAHFDVGVEAGIGAVGVRRVAITATEEQRSFRPRVAGKAGAVAMAYLHGHVALRLDLVGLFFGAGGENVKVPFEASLGVSVFLPSLAGE